MTDDTKVPPCQGHAFQNDWEDNPGIAPDLPPFSIVELRFKSGHQAVGYVNSWVWYNSREMGLSAIEQYRVVRVGA